MNSDRLKKFKWPFDSAVTIALFALMVSVAQFVVTAPLLTNFYVRPKLTVTGIGSDPRADVLHGEFYVKNEGNAPATKVEIGIGIQVNQRLVLIPHIATVVEQENPVLVKNVRIEIERLLPGEFLAILVIPGLANEKLHNPLAEHLVKLGMKEFPSVTFVRSSEGGGKIIKQQAPELRPIARD